MYRFDSTEQIAGISVADIQRVLSNDLHFRKKHRWGVAELGSALGIDATHAAALLKELLEWELVVDLKIEWPSEPECRYGVTRDGANMIVLFHEVPPDQDARQYAEKPKAVILRELEICAKAEDAIKLLAGYKVTEIREISVTPAGGHFAKWKRHKEYSLIQIGLRNPVEWYKTLYQKDMSIISDQFIFCILKRLGKGKLLVLAARKGRGCSVRLAPALATLKDNFAWELNWDNLPPETALLAAKVISPQNQNDYFFKDAHYLQASSKKLNMRLHELGKHDPGTQRMLALLREHE